jgi:hypothetical protein
MKRAAIDLRSVGRNTALIDEEVLADVIREEEHDHGERQAYES